MHYVGATRKKLVFGFTFDFNDIMFKLKIVAAQRVVKIKSNYIGHP